jgi:hypothetical protein
LCKIADLPATALRVTTDTQRSKQRSAAERRRAKRSALRMRANMTLPGDLTIESHTIDISLTGLSCRVPYMLEAGQFCSVELDLKKFGGDTVELRTTVRHCGESPDGRIQAGLEFVNPPQDVMKLLRAHLR